MKHNKLMLLAALSAIALTGCNSSTSSDTPDIPSKPDEDQSPPWGNPDIPSIPPSSDPHPDFEKDEDGKWTCASLHSYNVAGSGYYYQYDGEGYNACFGDVAGITYDVNSQELSKAEYDNLYTDDYLTYQANVFYHSNTEELATLAISYYVDSGISHKEVLHFYNGQYLRINYDTITGEEESRIERELYEDDSRFKEKFLVDYHVLSEVFYFMTEGV
ncbi:hypothetical protein LO82_03630 [Vibrio vulnificus]|uniref:hypothetical protein n=1 Tax=Vibrio vulnificus TaxID=672 RepID=UPI0006AD323E|nr:hypothetical protein [Vibrio vulnificus]KOR99336.1 hypothetical protein LO82_03630 [Vibrio vulnificus]HDY8063646.1 hypothetical protein [Vibrio vulnificus]